MTATETQVSAETDRARCRPTRHALFGNQGSTILRSLGAWLLVFLLSATLQPLYGGGGGGGGGVSTWTGGGVTDSWSDSANWDPLGPVDDDQLVFVQGQGIKTTLNDLNSLAVNGISLTNDALGNQYTLNGNLIIMQNDGGAPGSPFITTTASTNGAIVDTISLDIDLRDELTVTTNFDHNLIYSGVVTSGGGPGNKRLIKQGVGSFTLTGIGSDFQDGITVNAGTLVLEGATGDALDNDNDVTVNAGGRLEVDTAEAIRTLNGAGQVQLDAALTIAAETGNMTFSGQLSGTGDLIKGDAGVPGQDSTTILSGNNIFTGNTDIGSGFIELQHASSNNLSASPLIEVAESGHLDVRGLNAGTIVLSSGQTLRGIGVLAGGSRVEAVLGNVTVAAGSTLTSGTELLGVPPDPRGLFTIDGNVTLQTDGTNLFQLGGTAVEEYDQLSITGAYAANGGTIDVDLVNGFSPLQGNVFNLVDWGSFTGTPTFDFDDADLAPGLAWDTSTFSTDGQISVIAAAAGGNIWDINGANAGATDTTVASGLWSGDNWTGTADGTAATGSFVTGTTPTTFSAGTNATGESVITVDQNASVFGLKFEDGSKVTLAADAGNTLTLTDATVAVASGVSAEIGAPLAGSLGITKEGPGLLTLTGTNTLTGATAINAGTLAVNNGSALDDGTAVTIASTALFSVLGSETVGSVAGAGNVSLNTGATLTTGSAGSTTLSGVISGAGNLSKAGTSTFILSGTNTYTGDTAIATGGTLEIGGTGSLGAGDYAGAITNDGLFNYNSSTSQNLGGVISGSGGLVKNNASSTLTLTAANTYTGATTVNAGILDLGGAGETLEGSIGSSSLTTINSTATLTGSGTTGALTVAQGGFHKPGQSPGITNTGNYTLNGNLEIELLGTFTGSAPTAGSDFDQVNVTGSVNLGGTSSLTALAYGLDTTFDPTFGTVFSIINNDDADAVVGQFNGLADAADAVVINGKTLKIYYNADGGLNGNFNDVVLVSATGTANALYVDADFSGGVVDGNQEEALFQQAFFNLDAFTSTGAAFSAMATPFGGTLTLNADDTAYVVDLSTGNAGAVTVNLVADSNETATDVTISTLTGDVGDLIVINSEATTPGNGDLVVQQGTFGGVLSDGAVDGNLTKTTAGTLNLSGANTYDGTTTISGGILSAQHANALGSTNAGTTVASGASLVVANNVTTDAEALTINGTGAGGIGALSGAASSTGEYTGNVTLGSDARIQADGAFEVSGTVANSGHTLDARANTGPLTLSGAISGAGGLDANNGTSGTVTLTGTNSYSGITKVSGGVLALNNTSTANGAIAGDANPETNAADFDIQVVGGILRNDFNEQIANNAEINITTGGTYQLNGQTETIQALTNSGGTFTTGENGKLVGLGNTITWSGGTNTINTGGTVEDKHWDVSGGDNTVEGGATSGTLRVLSGGTGFEFTGSVNPGIKLNSDNTSAGRMLLEADLSVASSLTGTASITTEGAGSKDGFIDMAGGQRTFTVNNGSAATDLNISAQVTNGGLTKSGAGTMQLSNIDNIYADDTVINEGTLALSNGGTKNNIANSLLIEVAAGATLDVSGLNASEFELAANQTLRGTGTVTGGTVIATSGSRITAGIGDNGTGALTVNGNVDLQTGSTGLFQLGGTTPPAYDQLKLNTGFEFTANGTIDVDLINGFNPQLNDVFDLVDFTTFSGTPEAFNFSNAGLAAGLQWDTTQFSSTGEIKVIASPIIPAYNIWDINNDTTGATDDDIGGVASGFWSGANWTSDPNGESPTGSFETGTTATTFSAGTNAGGSSEITVDQDANVFGLNFEEGTVTLLKNTPISHTLTLTDPTITVSSPASADIQTSLAGSVGLTKEGDGTLTLSASNAITGATTINAGTLVANDPSNNALSDSTAVTVASGAQFSVNTDETVGSVAGAGNVLLNTGATLTTGDTTSTELSGAITGSGNLVKRGSGTFTLNGVNTFTGTTTVEAGTLLVTNNSPDATGKVTVSAGGTLAGPGSIGGEVEIGSGAVVSPGNSPGTLGSASQTWLDGGAFLFEINDATGTAGADPGWDLLVISGDLDLGALTASGFTVDIDSLTLGNAPGLAANFTEQNAVGTADFSFEFVRTTTGVIGFDAGDFSLDDAGFLNSNWAWSIRQDGNSLFLDVDFLGGGGGGGGGNPFEGIPEPSRAVLLMLGALSCLMRRRR